MDYRNVCCFLIFVLGFFCYELYKENQELKKLALDQDKAIQDLQKALTITTWNYYYGNPKQSLDKNNPVH